MNKKQLAALEDKVLAHRYRYYVLAEPVISDHEYDALEAEARAKLPETSDVHKVGSDLPSSYSDRVVELAKQLGVA